MNDCCRDVIRKAKADEREACLAIAADARTGPWRSDVEKALRARVGEEGHVFVVEGDATAKPTNRWGIESDGDTVDLRGKMSGGLSMPVKLGDATPGPEPDLIWLHDEQAGCATGVERATPPKKGTGR